MSGPLGRDDWRRVETGGGCTALRADDPDGSCWLVTRADDASSPEPGEPFVAGRYGAGGADGADALPVEWVKGQTPM